MGKTYTLEELEHLLAAITPGERSTFVNGTSFAEVYAGDRYHFTLLGNDDDSMTHQADAEFYAVAPDIARQLLALLKNGRE